MRERMPDHEATVVVHEHAHVQPLCAPQSKREDVRLPQLIRHRTFKSPGRVLARGRRLWRLDETLVVQNPPHLLLADSQRFEAGQYVADSARAPLLVFALEAQYLVSLDALFRPRLTTRFPAPWL